MGNAFYNRRSGSNKRAGVSEESIKLKSPIYSDVEHVFKMRYIESEEIESTTYKSPYNRRSESHLTMGAVLDILPEIQRDKQNQHPALGYMDDSGKIEVLAGMRRRKAVSLVDDGLFGILTCSTLDEKEKAVFARTSDNYQEPTSIDIGFSILELKAAKASKGETIVREELAEIFNVSTGKISECESFANLPSELFSLFPSLESISYRFLREIKKVKKDSEPKLRQAITDAIDDGMRVAVNAQDSADTIKVRCKKLEQELLAMVSPKKPAKKAPVTRWSNLKAKKGLNIKVKPNGSVSLDIDEDKADKKMLEALFKLLSEA